MDPKSNILEIASRVGGGMQSAAHTDPTSVLKHIDSGSDSSPTSLANIINNAFLPQFIQLFLWILNFLLLRNTLMHQRLLSSVS